MSTGTNVNDTVRSAASGTSLWAPLAHPKFRALWSAQVAAAVGIWTHTIGGQWLLVSAEASATVVAAVQAAIALPFFLFALPAGVLADAVERRTVLVWTQGVMAVGSAALGVATLFGEPSGATILTVSFLLGTGSVVGIVAWQAMMPTLVGRRLVPAAATLDGLSFNAGRVVGPAMGGLMLSAMGPPSVFGFTALAYGFSAAAFWRWAPPNTSRASSARLGPALRAASGYVRHSPVTRRLLLRLSLWTLPASAIWALLPAISGRQLHLAAGGFGALFAVLGAGAVLGSILLQPLRNRLSANAMLGLCSVAFAGGLVLVAFSRTVAVAAFALAVVGASWITVLSTLVAIAQSCLPEWVRARGLATVLLVQQGCQTIGSLLWGGIADTASLTWSLNAAAALLLVGALSLVRLGLRSTASVDPVPVSFWVGGEQVQEIDPARGPVDVMVEYHVPAESRSEFLTAVHLLEGARRRTGARRWELLQDSARPAWFVERYAVASWGEHVEQESLRWTRADKRLRDQVEALADSPPVVRRLLFVAPPPTRRT